MSWQLEISTIDVGQGESSLVIARDTAVAGQVRTMLIDGGLAGYAQTVHDYIAERLRVLGIPRLHHILVSHYDEDHSGGVLSLLASDNLYAVVEVIAQAAAAAVAAAAVRRTSRENQIAAGAAAAAAAACGGYDMPGAAYSSIAVNAGRDAEDLDLDPADGDRQNASAGAREGRTVARGAKNANPGLIVSTKSVITAAVAAALGAIDPIGGATPDAQARQNLFQAIKSAVPSAVMTNGIYHTTHVIDIGDTSHVPDEYRQLVNGGVQLWRDHLAEPPGIDRQRTSLDQASLGDEVLWNSGPNAGPAPAGSPAAFVVACNKYVWRAPAKSCPIASGQPENDDSIALVVRFGSFFFYTGGDLPSEGEDLVANAVRTYGLPNPQGGTFGVPGRIAAFKCGHHGSDHSTSDYFLGRIDPAVAAISCGQNTFGTGDRHPTEAVVKRLCSMPQLWFYLTNCNYEEPLIPATMGLDQLYPANRSRVCGDNNDDDNLAVGRQRGDIRLYLDQDESTGTNGPQQFHVHYWDNDDSAGPGSALVGMRTEDHAF